jgi:hypothetical protein
MLNLLDEHWRIGDESCVIVADGGQFIADCNSKDADDPEIDVDIAIAHHIISIHNDWLECDNGD